MKTYKTMNPCGSVRHNSLPVPTLPSHPPGIWPTEATHL